MSGAIDPLERVILRFLQEAKDMPDQAVRKEIGQAAYARYKDLLSREKVADARVRKMRERMATAARGTELAFDLLTSGLEEDGKAEKV